MTSTPYIEIDWSSTSQHPFPQLGDPTPPENDSDKILHNTELPTLLHNEINAEIEEVSYGGNNIPSFSNTPLTPIQDNIPLPPSDIAPISENLLKDGKKTTLL
ncbi:7084_t:CDS:2, partial [Rhizophagus irregularis]